MARPGSIALLLCSLALAGCPAPEREITLRFGYPERVGDPIPGLSDAQLAQWERGQAVMRRIFLPSDGLGPSYNASSCDACHHFPATGGASSRFRDVFLLREDGEDVGTDPEGPLRKLYDTEHGHRPEPGTPDVVARRAPLPALGTGLFGFVPVEEILSRVDPRDADGDGISGRAHYVGETVGRWGYKAQAGTMEQVVRTALKEQLGLTTPELGWVPEELREPETTDPLAALQRALVGIARAHPHNRSEDPSRDDDGVPDPELSASDLEDLLVFLTYLGPPPPATDVDPAGRDRGEALFGEIGCARCHVPTLDSPIGPIPAYSDLLLHDMEDWLGPDTPHGEASSTELRTTPLLGIRLHVPYLHDSSAPAFEFTMLGHRGEAAASAAAYEALSEEERTDVALFLNSLGGWNPKGRFLAADDVPLPEVGEAGGPDRALSDWEHTLFVRGREKFDRMTAPSFNSGLGRFFNADSCRACHFQPALGGAGPNDVNVLLFDGDRSVEGAVDWPLGPGTMPRSVITRVDPWWLPEYADVVEQRSAPSLLGLGLLEQVPAAEILALADPEDADGDGISGRVRVLEDGRLGRFGWKARVPTLVDFAADALAGELSITVEERYSIYTKADDGDWFDDPEIQDRTPLEMGFYLEHLAPPARREPGDAAEAARGEALFADLGCADCHRPELGGVAAYTDLLLHDVAPAGAALVNREPGVLPTEFRTPPLWGIGETGPYLHDGSAETLGEAITEGHFGEADAARAAYEAASEADRAALREFLLTL